MRSTSEPPQEEPQGAERSTQNLPKHKLGRERKTKASERSPLLFLCDQQQREAPLPGVPPPSPSWSRFFQLTTGTSEIREGKSAFR